MSDTHLTVDPQLNLRIIDPEGFFIGADAFDNITNTIGAGAVYTQIDGKRLDYSEST